MPFRTVVLAFLLSVSCFAVDNPSPSEFKERRAKLRKDLGESSALVLMGAKEDDHGDLRGGFFQEANFFYLTGWNEPGAILVLTPDTGILFVPGRNKDDEKWTGPKAVPGDPSIAAITGIDQVLATESLEASLPKLLENVSKVYSLSTNGMEDLAKLLPLRTVRDAKLNVARLRMVKSAAELSLIQRSTDITIEAHKAAWNRIKPGLTEGQIAATMSNTYFERGCERHAYAPIVGSGKNAATLHYSRNNRKMDAGEVLLMDVGSECSMYATDITRTVPVTGKFTARQREIYDIVLGAQKAAIAAVKPGAMLNKHGLQKIALDYIDSHGKDKEGNSLGKYFTHGLGHHVGLDVHDPTDPVVPLAPGMVITIEPGIYLPEEGIGVRIEDMILVTETGSKLMSGALPREANEIEKAMAR